MASCWGLPSRISSPAMMRACMPTLPVCSSLPLLHLWPHPCPRPPLPCFRILCLQHPLPTPPSCYLCCQHLQLERCMSWSLPCNTSQTFNHLTVMCVAVMPWSWLLPMLVFPLLQYGSPSVQLINPLPNHCQVCIRAPALTWHSWCKWTTVTIRITRSKLMQTIHFRRSDADSRTSPCSWTASSATWFMMQHGLPYAPSQILPLHLG